jgi:hypothetical protein
MDMTQGRLEDSNGLSSFPGFQETSELSFKFFMGNISAFQPLSVRLPSGIAWRLTTLVLPNHWGICDMK